MIFKAKLLFLTSMAIGLIVGCTHPNSQTRGPASLITQTQFSETIIKTEIKDTQRIVNVCGKQFSEISWTSSHPNTKITFKKMNLPNTALAYFVPNLIEVRNYTKNTNLKLMSITRRGSNIINLNYPPLPDLPITKDGLTPDVCKLVVDYYDNYMKSGSKKISLPFDMAKNSISNYQKNKSQYIEQANQLMNQFATSKVKGVIFYDPLYTEEAQSLAQVHANKGIKLLLKSVESLPGYDARSETPMDCEGEFYQECYHTWGDPIEGVSQRAVPTLKGFHRQTKIYEGYERVSYIPGLIRAEVRRLKRLYTIQSIILLGPDEVIAPYPIMVSKFGQYNYNDGPNFRKTMLFTDLFYMVPDLPLKVETKTQHVNVTAMLWSCKNPQGTITLRYWCLDDEERHWPNLPLTAYRWPAYSPTSRIFSSKYYFGHPFFEALNPNQYIAVGRIPTQEKIIGDKDPLIGGYASKFSNWMTNPPKLIDTPSIMSNGGTTDDSWIFQAEDVNAFTSTYGANGVKYASEFFVSLPKCTNCSYKTGSEIISEIKDNPRFITLLINGHGGHSGVQAPYGNGNVASIYRSENYGGVAGDNVRLKYYTYPESTTLYPLEESQSLIGHVVANSCDLSDYNLDNEINKLVTNMNPHANERSFAEQLLLVKNGGAVTTFLNNDVGWGYSDNYYNAAFMDSVTNTLENCGNIGDAVRNLIQQMLTGNNSGYQFNWQIYNRQFLGSPFTAIAKLPDRCTSNSPNPQYPTESSFQ